MEEIAIKINGLSKIYKLYDRPIDRLKETLSPRHKSYHKDFYALNDINLTIKKGETVGIIGKNGAGKSTLLKIITGVLSPSAGSVEINGRISSLLELGAGFNPEYTGIENIYLNGTIMGLSKEETDARLDSILSFADIGDFAYQPVKTYSSGMYVRLAFSVAINVKPDILIVDEALAVGDARFQLKCFQKLDQMRNDGLTIVFVSHDTSTIKSLCSKAYLINDGTIISSGDPQYVCLEYFKLIFPAEQPDDSKKEQPSLNDSASIIVPQRSYVNSFGIGGVDIEAVTISDVNINDLKGGEKITIKVRFNYNSRFLTQTIEDKELENNLISGISISDSKGTYLFGMTTIDKNIVLPIEKEELYCINYVFYFPYLASGEYLLNTAVALGTQENHVQLKWFDGFAVLRVHSCKKNVYGVFYNDYTVEKK